jgi:hypothetical protein
MPEAGSFVAVNTSDRATADEQAESIRSQGHTVVVEKQPDGQYHVIVTPKKEA